MIRRKDFHFHAKLFKTPPQNSLLPSTRLKTGTMVETANPQLTNRLELKILMIVLKSFAQKPQKFLPSPSLLHLPPDSSCQVFQPPLSPLLACRMDEGGGHLRPGSTALLSPLLSSSGDKDKAVDAPPPKELFEDESDPPPGDKDKADDAPPPKET